MVKDREYLFSIDSFNHPIVYTGQKAIGLLLTELILRQPGSDPLHPELGVGITNYRYTMDQLSELKARIQDQANTYLPEDYKCSDITLVTTPDHLCNIEITINGTVYVYNSSEAPVKITIEDAS